jgi:hypothetical protein
MRTNLLAKCERGVGAPPRCRPRAGVVSCASSVETVPGLLSVGLGHRRAALGRVAGAVGVFGVLLADLLPVAESQAEPPFAVVPLGPLGSLPAAVGVPEVEFYVVLRADSVVGVVVALFAVGSLLYILGIGTEPDSAPAVGQLRGVFFVVLVALGLPALAFCFGRLLASFLWRRALFLLLLLLFLFFLFFLQQLLRLRLVERTGALESTFWCSWEGGT